MGHEGGGRGHFSLSDVVIISLLRIAGPVISPLLAKYPNDSRADIKCHANSLHNIMSGSREGTSAGPQLWHGTSQGSSQKTDILFLTRHTATIRTQDDENKIL